MTRRRTLAVQIDEIAIGDGEIVPPSLGHVIEFPLRFVEQPSTADTVTIRALLEASNRDPIFQYTGHDSPRRWEWNGLLRGDGWTASWRGFTPRTGHVELTGRFYGVMGYDTPSYVRGRVTRVQLVSERYRRPPESHGWNVVPGHRTLRDVEAAPRFFDNDMFMRDDLFEVDRAVGVVVDLDLDDVPPVPPRPTIVPGDVSASGEMLWVIDSQLPAVVSIDPNRVAHEYVLPGPIGHSRHVWATPTGCWVGGHDGLYRCVIGEEPRKIFDRPVPQGAAIGEHFLACPSAATWPLYNQDNEPVEVDVPDGYVRSIAVDGESFVVLAEQRQTDAASTYRLIRVNVSGDVIVGPEMPTIPGRRGASPYLAGTPLRIFRSGTASRILPDLTLGAVEQLDGDPFHGGQVGDFVWIIDHPPDGTSRTGWWPLPGPVDYDRTRRQFWLFTLLDAATLEPVMSTPIFATNPPVTADGKGIVWVRAAGVQSIPTESMQWPDDLDVAALLDEN
ncbi:hypothetical protein JXX30_00375 [Rhodococcus erythropolis]|uniref:DUF6578 domain-containing protein n=1 Tax=Rhodococcus erythropolis TaxID=1833 RepID=UPI001982311D|nr:DUF6578 domain-containing protein [Rhodococcus erythropolis]QSE41331.1 hypothetical protein JXX30_00375 [Rhodococcus erythropolis]